jgi:hydroxymethylpyrimidine/phosphomethylpyrimidine kinase
MIPIALTIAGSDPSGGAGIQADLKTFAALGVYGTAVITALTAQNTCGVTGVHPVPPEFVAGQIDTLWADVRIDALKIGMVASADIASAVADALERHRATNVVLDPVMMAKGGEALLDPAAVSVVRDRLVPLSTVITPNVLEAGVLLGDAVATIRDARSAARALGARGARAVVLKGGHIDGPTSIDVLFDGDRVHDLEGPRIVTRNTHGTGCTLSAAIAAQLARGLPLIEACRLAKEYLTKALEAADSLGVGHGIGPVHHGWQTTPL